MEEKSIEQRLDGLEQKMDALTSYLMGNHASVPAEPKRPEVNAVGSEPKRSEGKTAEPAPENVPAEKPVAAPAQAQGRLEAQLAFILEKKESCKDPNFASYLDAMQKKLLAELSKVEEIEENLKKNYEIYLKNNPPAPAVKESELRLQTKNPTAAAKVTEEAMTKGDTLVTKQADSADGIGGQVKMQAESGLERTEASAVTGAVGASMPPAGTVAADLSQDVPAKDDIPTEKPDAWSDRADWTKAANAAGRTGGTERRQPKQKEAKKAFDLEFGIGGALLSAVGALFIIAAFVIFGMNYMGSLAQGLLLYGLGAVVIVLSEFVIKKSLEKFSRAVTALGIGILYTATILNYLYLHTINAAIAIILTVAIAGFSLFISQKRESSTLRIVGILGAYICFAPITAFESVMDFVIPAVMTLIINGIYLFLPLKENNRIVANVHAFANMVFVCSMAAVAQSSDISVWPIAVFVLVAMVFTHLIYRQIEMEAVSTSVFSVCAAVLGILYMIVWFGDEKVVFAVLLYAAAQVLCFFLSRGQNIRWVGLYCFSAIAPIMLYAEEKTYCYVGVAVILLLYKVLARVKELRWANIVCSVISALIFLTALDQKAGLEYLILAVFVLSVVTITYDKLFHVLTLTAVLQGMALIAFEGMIAIPLAIALLLLCLLFFTYVDLACMRGNKGFGITVFVWNCILVLAFAVLEQPVALTICLVCELAFLFVWFSRSAGYCGLALEKGRYLILMIYLTYMVFIYRIEIPLIVSIILMLIAIASVAVGFVFKQKMVRVYGLLLAFFVCFKLLLIDFKGEQSSDRILLFFFVGLLALAISYLYMRIERNLQREEELQSSQPADAFSENPALQPMQEFEPQPKEQFVQTAETADEQQTLQFEQPVSNQENARF